MPRKRRMSDDEILTALAGAGAISVKNLAVQLGYSRANMAARLKRIDGVKLERRYLEIGNTSGAYSNVKTKEMFAVYGQE